MVWGFNHVYIYTYTVMYSCLLEPLEEVLLARHSTARPGMSVSPEEKGTKIFVKWGFSIR